MLAVNKLSTKNNERIGRNLSRQLSSEIGEEFPTNLIIQRNRPNPKAC